MGRLGDSLATALIARPSAPRDARSEGGFSAHLDAARDSIRENRESRALDKRDRVEARENAAPLDDADASQPPRDDDSIPTGEPRDSTAASGLIAAPIVVVTIAGPLAPVAEGGDAAASELPVSDAAADATIRPAAVEAPVGANTASSQVARDVGEIGPVAELHQSRGDATVETNQDDASTSPSLPMKAAQANTPVMNADVSMPRIEHGAVVDKIASRNQSLADTGKHDDAKPDLKTESTVSRSVQQSTVSLNNDVVSDQTHAQPEGETIRDVRVGDALNRALYGESRQPARAGASNRDGAQQQFALAAAIPQIHEPGRASPRSNELAKSESITRATGASGIEGDSAAAAIGKFLAGVSTSVDPIRTANRDAGGGAAGRSNQQSSQSPALSAATGSTTGNAKTQGGIRTASPAGATFSQILSTRLDPASSMEGTARVLAANGGAGRHQVTLRLSPAELGELRLDVRMQAGAMSLRVDADNAAAGRLIESRMNELREALSAHGISIERAEVVVRSDASANSGFEHRSSSDEAPPRQHSPHGESADGSWNFNSGHSFAGDRSWRSDANPWWTYGDATGVDVEPPTHAMRHDEGAVSAIMQDGSLDLVA